MKSSFPHLMLDFIIALIFLILLKVSTFSIAIITVLLFSALTLGYKVLTQDKFPVMSAVSFLTLAFFGTLSLVFHSPQAFQMKTSIIYGVASLVFFVTPWFKKTTMLEIVWTETSIKPKMAKQANQWIISLLIGASLSNFYVAKVATIEQWAVFKLGLSIVVSLILTGILYIIINQKDKESREKS